ncbi:MAG: winged helix-turn-helix transcriptional regulator [Actinobacteria bacterium]|nr:winged helix-turn-helix transcriptional regulator [Actinomycetota bacterium]
MIRLSLAERHEYLLTDKGRDLAPALLMIMKWGGQYYPNPAGPPRYLPRRAGLGLKACSDESPARWWSSLAWPPRAAQWPFPSGGHT